MEPKSPLERRTCVDPWAGQRKLLAVADVQTGYHHDSISQTLATIQRLGHESKTFVTNIRTDSQLITRRPIVGQGSKYGGKPVNARGLTDYDALFLLPSGEGTLSDEQKSDLLSFVHDDGKGLIVGHAGILGFYNWPQFSEMVGAGFGGEFNAVATIRIEDPTFPGVEAFGDSPFDFFEQHPISKEPFDRDKINVVFSVDPDSIDSASRNKRTDDDFPVVWSRNFGKGRIFHVGWGHHEATWDDSRFKSLMLNGILWAMKAI